MKVCGTGKDLPVIFIKQLILYFNLIMYPYQLLCTWRFGIDYIEIYILYIAYKIVS